MTSTTLKERGLGMTHKILNAGNMLGATAFLALLAAPGTWEAAIEGKGPYMAAIAVTALFGACAYLSVREGGRKR